MVGAVMTEFDSDTFEHDYILKLIESMMIETLIDGRTQPTVADKYAVALTAFMNGQIVQALKNRANPPDSA